MKKSLIITIFLILSSFISINIYKYILSKSVNKIVNSSIKTNNNISCNLVQGNDLQAQSCYRNFLTNNSDYYNLGDTILEHSCDNGKFKACSLRSSIDEFQKSLGVPKKSSPKLVNIIYNCTNPNSKDEAAFMNMGYDKDAYCEQIIDLATSSKDYTLLTLAAGTNCNKYLDICKKYVSYNVFNSQSENEFLFHVNCIQQNIDRNYCSTLNNTISFQKEFYKSFYTKPLNSRSLSDTDSICSKYKAQCEIAFSQPLYFQRLIQQLPTDEKFNKLKYYDKFQLNFESAWQLAMNIELDNISTNYHNRSLKFLKYFLHNKQNSILEECNKEKDKRYCFMSFNKLSDAKKNLPYINEFCKAGDETSCSYLKIIEYSKQFAISDDLPIYKVHLNWEWYQINSLRVDPLHSFLRILNNLKFPLMIIFTLVFIFLTFSFLILGNKLNELLKHFRQKKIEELKEKINNKLK